MTDNINHPDHYLNASGVIEPIHFCRLFPFAFGNFCKYVLRADYKGKKIEDLKKALVYLKWAHEDCFRILEFRTLLIQNKHLAECFNNKLLNDFFNFKYDTDLNLHFQQKIMLLSQYIYSLEQDNGGRETV